MARAFPGQVPFGTVTVGARGDLVLSEGNPLEGLETLRRPLGVMAAGRWYGREELQALLQGVAQRYKDAGFPG